MPSREKILVSKVRTDPCYLAGLPQPGQAQIESLKDALRRTAAIQPAPDATKRTALLRGLPARASRPVPREARAGAPVFRNGRLVVSENATASAQNATATAPSDSGMCPIGITVRRLTALAPPVRSARWVPGS